MATQQLPITSPIKGVVRAVPREGQPAETCWDAVNVLPYDRYGRKRVAQRPGIQKEFPQQLESSFVQGMIEAPNIIYPPGTFARPLGGIENLVNPFSFSTPGTSGPFSQPSSFPSVAANLDFTWTFTLRVLINVNTVIAQNGTATQTGSVYFYFPVEAEDFSDVILELLISNSVVTTGGGPFTVTGNVAVTFNTYYGDHTDIPDWTSFSLSPGSPVVSAAGLGALPIGVDASMSFTIHPNGHVSLAGSVVATPQPPAAGGATVGITNSPATGSDTESGTLFPTLNVLSVTINAPAGAPVWAPFMTTEISITD